MTQSGWGEWQASWIWSLVLIGVTVAFHSAGIVLISRVRRKFWNAPLRKDLRTAHPTLIAIGVIVGVALSLAILHGAESMMWAIAYLKFGALGTPADAVLFSVDSMATRGSAGYSLEGRWRMMGAIESIDGMLLFGISTAFLFTVMQRILLPTSRTSERS